MSVAVVDSKIVCWTDSLVALWWIKGVDKNWKVWVENRVGKIREKVDSSHCAKNHIFQVLEYHRKLKKTT